MELFKTFSTLPVPCMNIMEYVIIPYDMLVTSVMIHINSYLYIEVWMCPVRICQEKWIKNILIYSTTMAHVYSETCPTILRGVHLFLIWFCVCAGVGGSFWPCDMCGCFHPQQIPGSIRVSWCKSHCMGHKHWQWYPCTDRPPWICDMCKSHRRW